MNAKTHGRGERRRTGRSARFWNARPPARVWNARAHQHERPAAAQPQVRAGVRGPRIGRPGWCRSIRCAVARRQICSMPVCRAGEPSRTKRADDGIHLVSYTVIDRLLFTCSTICGLSVTSTIVVRRRGGSTACSTRAVGRGGGKRTDRLPASNSGERLHHLQAKVAGVCRVLAPSLSPLPSPPTRARLLPACSDFPRTLRYPLSTRHRVCTSTLSTAHEASQPVPPAAG